MQWTDSAASWTRALPAVLIVAAAGPAERRAALRALVARALAVAEEGVTIEHRPGRAPRLLHPAAPLILSSASRGGLAALALADGPVGVDVELAEADIPWRVLHPAEAASLRARPDPARAAAFARLWSLKEAYLKALGVGLAREPSGFAVHLRDEAEATIDDPHAPGAVARATTLWRELDGRPAAISAVLLHPRARLM